jgi:endo-1,4-beta-xylanase
MKFRNLLLLWIVTSLQSSAQIAGDNCKFLGNIIGYSTPSDFTLYWNQVTPENAGKWGSAEATRDVMNWTPLDNIYNTAKDNNMLFRQHTFVWGQQQPAWLAGLSSVEQKEEVEEWIQSYCSRYPETDFIDVVNEPIHAPPTYKAALGGDGSTGWDWVIWSFEKARQHCPNAKLFLNDYNIINSASATNAYIQIINLLKARNLIDGIGEQGHFLEAVPLTTIKENLNKLGELDLPIHISEFDVHILSDTDQKNKYAELFPALWSHPAVKGVTLWGYRQGEIWRENAYLIRSNGTNRPAFTWLQEYVTGTTGESFCQPIVSTEEDELNMFDVYPNPVQSGNLNVRVPRGFETLTIMDITGRLQGRFEVADGLNEIHFTTSPGIFLMVIENDRKRLVRKFSVE